MPDHAKKTNQCDEPLQSERTFVASCLFELIAREQSEDAAMVGRQALQHDRDVIRARFRFAVDDRCVKARLRLVRQVRRHIVRDPVEARQ